MPTLFALINTVAEETAAHLARGRSGPLHHQLLDLAETVNRAAQLADRLPVRSYLEAADLLTPASRRLALLLALAANPATQRRRQILVYLTQHGPAPAPVIAAHFRLTPTTVSRHLAVLAAEQLVCATGYQSTRTKPRTLWQAQGEPTP
jgi:hypothetical protein